ncbi:MAG: hypothetical protein HWQ35_22640 [Nostoc sp. NMS1]|uniref:hypothetical protein n=1 Tax=unclassified Nostoc TaxID=2593658 RepID=UPI0025E2F6A6|nr:MULTISPECIES: hypothetical protein [unclassified Nostoc]MBN3909251.1 hypothetical protein [Nostoc sp. NMS1]MBN3993335.1 hypothetical protein [Nostoc sp. NMS2]
MLALSYTRNFFILICLFSLGCYNTNSSTVATSQENQPQFSINDGCKINFDPKTSEFKLASKITVSTQSPRARCIIRINTSNAQKQFRLVPLALKGEVKKAPATVAISSILIGEQQQPTSVSKKYTSSTKFDLTNQIPKTNYTTKEKSVLGINLVLMTTEGELDVTEMKFALQEK